MRYTELTETSAAERFPSLVKAVEKGYEKAPKRVAPFIEALEKALSAHAAGEIPNVVFNDVKSVLSYGAEKAQDYLRQAHLYPSYHSNAMSDEDRTLDAGFGIFSLHTAPTMLARMEKALPKAGAALKTYIEANLPFLRDAAQLAGIVKELKGMAVKRQPKPVEDKKAKYSAPEASMTAIQQVKATLEQVTQESRDALVTAFANRFNRDLDKFKSINAARVADGKKELGPDAIFNTNPKYSFKDRELAKNYDPDAFQIVSRVVDTEQTYSGTIVTIKPDADAIFKAMAEKEADAIRDTFVYKNLGKFDSILEAKGNFEKIEIVGRQIDMWGLTGSFKVTFTDGSSFIAQNGSVYVVNSHGTRFMRYPLTFHNVVLADGSKMKGPSEERMNTVFVGKA